MFVGWGAEPCVSEFRRSGQLVFDAELGAEYVSYRAFRLPWTGPARRSAGARTVRADDGLTAYVSWNGATGVESWQLLAGAQANALSAVASTRSHGFESAMRANVAAGQYVAVQALGPGGAPLGQSRTVAV